MTFDATVVSDTCNVLQRQNISCSYLYTSNFAFFAAAPYMDAIAVVLFFLAGSVATRHAAILIARIEGAASSGSTSGTSGVPIHNEVAAMKESQEQPAKTV